MATARSADSSISATKPSITARTSASLVGKRRKNVALPTPARRAIASTPTSRPCSAKHSRAATRMRSRLRWASTRSGVASETGTDKMVSHVRPSGPLMLRSCGPAGPVVFDPSPPRSMSSFTAARSDRAQRSWLVVVVIVCLAQFMVVLDATITLVALPSIQSDLHFAPSDLQWVINAYLLAFGGFLLLGGRAGDLFGRRRLFLAGVGLFTVASALDAAATSPGFLVAARALQGLGAALVSPAALSIITSTVPEGPDRAKALGAFAAISGGGGAVGLILGGLLTDALSWEWVFFVNVPIGLITLLLALRFVPESRAEDREGGFDLVGATLVTSGLIVLPYAIVKAQDFGWGSGRTLGLAAVAVVLLAAFVYTQTRRAAPLVKLSIFRKRTLTTGNFVTLFLLSRMQAFFFFGSLYFQQIRGFNALESGAAFVPMTLGIIAGSVVSQRLIARFGVKAVLLGGLVVGTAGLLWMTGLTPESDYATGFLPGILLLAL